MNRRDVGFGLAVAIALVGLLAALTPVLDASAFAAESLTPVLGAGSAAVGAAVLRRWYRSEPRSHEPPEYERLAPVAVAGREFDELLALAGSGSGETARYYRSQLRSELESVAVTVLATHRECTRAEAREQLRSGAWTDDQVAATFFVAGSDAPEGLRSLLPGRAGGQSATTRRTRRTVAELRRIAGAEARLDGTDSDGGVGGPDDGSGGSGDGAGSSGDGAGSSGDGAGRTDAGTAGSTNRASGSDDGAAEPDGERFADSESAAGSSGRADAEPAAGDADATDEASVAGDTGTNDGGSLATEPEATDETSTEVTD